MSITIANVESAAEQLRGIALRTPVMRFDAFGSSVACKLENRQVTGSFKIRGAYNCASRLSEDQLAHGLVAISSGNHAQAVAKSAQLLGTSALIAMPEDSSEFKLDATRALGAEIVLFDRFARDRDDILRELLATSERAFIPPYDHPHVMAGQGTAALELFDEVADIDLLLVPMSGGGLMAGSATVAKARNPSIRVVGVEPETANDTQLSLANGERVWIEAPVTIADGLRVQTPGELTFEVNRRLVDEVVTVTDDEIVDAMALMKERGETVEPSGAVGIAALQSGRVDAAGQRAGVIISGGNVS
ncbi:MAG: threonine/serine dehydratase [Actinomycetota bacterium]